MSTKATTMVARPRERLQHYPSEPSIEQASLENVRAYKVAKIGLTPGAADSFPFAWQNPEGNKIIIHEVIVRITTAGGTGTAVLDIGPATSATGTADTIFDGIDLNATPVLSSHNVNDTGTNGDELPKVLDENGGTTAWLTGKCLIEKCDDLVGDVYIFYTEVEAGTDVTTAKTTTRVQRPRERAQNYPSDTSVSQADLERTRPYKVAKLDLEAGLADAFAFAWQNPEGNKIIIHEVIVRISTAGGTGSSVLDIDVVANATATGNTIFDGIDANATAVLSSHNVTDAVGSSNHKPHVVDENGGTNDWVTCKILVQNASALVGAAYIFYTEVEAGTDVTVGKIMTRVQRPRERPQYHPSDTSVAQADLERTRELKVAKVDLAGVAQNAFCFTWQNPESNKIIIHEVIVRITTAGGTATAVMDIDVVASAADTGNTIFNDIDLDSAPQNLTSHEIGSGGDEKPHVCDEKSGANDWVTGKCLTAKSDDLVGSVYIFYTEI